MPVSREQIISCHSVVACFPTDEMVIKYGAEPHLRHFLICSMANYFRRVPFSPCPVNWLSDCSYKSHCQLLGLGCNQERGSVQELMCLRQVSLVRESVSCFTSTLLRRHEAHLREIIPLGMVCRIFPTRMISRFARPGFLRRAHVLGRCRIRIGIFDLCYEFL